MTSSSYDFRNLKHFVVLHVTFSNVTSSNVTPDVFTRVSSVTSRRDVSNVMKIFHGRQLEFGGDSRPCNLKKLTLGNFMKFPRVSKVSDFHEFNSLPMENIRDVTDVTA